MPDPRLPAGTAKSMVAISESSIAPQTSVSLSTSLAPQRALRMSSAIGIGATSKQAASVAVVAPKSLSVVTEATKKGAHSRVPRSRCASREPQAVIFQRPA